jgi:hypothetical protein
MKAVAFIAAMAMSVSSQAQTTGPFDLICKHDGDVNVINGQKEAQFVPPTPAKDRHYSVDLSRRMYCSQDKKGFCSTTQTLTYDDSFIRFSERVSVNRRDGGLLSISDINGSLMSSMFKCGRAPFTPFPEQQF